jgi:cytochrome c5
VPGVWKSNFDKVYQFSQISPGLYAGEQFEGTLLIDKMEQKADKLLVAFRFEGKKGDAELKLHCQENEVLLKGTFQYPDRSGEWIFAKLKNAKSAVSGEKLFAANCSACHFADRQDVKVGPGLLGLFKSPKLPQSGQPATEEKVRQVIINGGDKMPPFKHLKTDELKAIVDYLKTL